MSTETLPEQGKPSVVGLSDAQHQCVRPSRVSGVPFSLEHELTLFGQWAGQPIWVPPRDASRELAESMLEHSGPGESFEKRWLSLAQRHRHQFTQVRELEIARDSIRLPKGRLYVTVTEKRDFDTITDKVPACVQTRLEEFLAGPGQCPGVRVYYLKPLCVEVDQQLIFTTRDELKAIIQSIQSQVHHHYRRRWLSHFLTKAAYGVLDGCTAIPRRILKQAWEKKKQAVDLYQRKLEFERRKTVMEALQARQKCRTDACSFDELLSVTRPMERREVMWRMARERQLNAKQFQDLMFTAGEVSLPWFITLSCTASVAASIAAKISLYLAPPVLACDPVFVAEMPDSRGQLLKIGHFDEIGGVMHVEI